MITHKSKIAIVCFSFLTCLGVAAAPTEQDITDQGFAGKFFYTGDAPRKMGVLVLGGAEGGIPRYKAPWIAQEGYPVLALGYFKVEGMPDYLDMIPLEYFDKPIDWLLNHEKTTSDSIVVLGGSKGAELALLLASRRKEIKGVVAFSTSSVVFQGIPKVFWPPRSSWKHAEKPIAFVPYDYSQGFNPNDLLGLYSHSLKQQQYVNQATIEVENINGPILLFSGLDDKLWPSAVMGDMICERLKAKEFKNPFEHIKYENAGHTLNEFYMLGGTPEGNKEARIDSSRRMYEFLKTLNSGENDLMKEPNQ